MTKQEWIIEAERLVQACRVFQAELAVDEDEDQPEEIDEIWSLTEDIISQYERLGRA